MYSLTKTPCLKILLLFFLSCNTVFAQRQNLLFESSFEGNDATYLDGFQNDQHCCEYSVTRTMAAARTGANAVRFEVRDDDAFVSSSIRSELTVPGISDVGERWYGMSFYLTNWIPDGARHSILQWHPDGSGGGPPVSLQAQDGLFRIVYGCDSIGYERIDNPLLGSPVSNVWTDFVFHIKWDTTANGYIEVWKNGVLAFSVYSLRTQWATGQYIKVGINHFGWSIPENDVATDRIFYVDDVRIGNGDATYEDVAPSPPQRKHLVFDNSFEGTNYLNGFNPEEYASCCDFSIQQSRDFAREGAYSTRFEVNDTDEVVSGSIGAEITFPDNYDTGEKWYGMSYYFGNYADDGSSEALVNWHPNSPGGGPVLALFVQSDKLVLVHQVANTPYDDYHYEEIDTVPLNQWVDFVFHVKWIDDNTGFIQFYLNGDLVYSVSSVRTDWADGQFMKIGINKFCWMGCSPASTVSQRVLYVDAVRIGDEDADYEDVAPGGFSSCIQPTATLTTTESCDGAPYYLVLSGATGSGPFDLDINNTIHYNIAVGDSIAVAQPAENLWSSYPGSAEGTENTALELGVKFSTNTAGFVKGVRFYSHSSPSGTYTGHLWSSSGTLLASATFTSVTGSAWQEAYFSTPVLIDANTTYVASYHTPTGNYKASSGWFWQNYTNGHLTAPSSGSSDGNGVYALGSSPTFPNSTYNSANYWADVIFIAVSDTFHLLNVTDAGGCTRTGDLQTVIVAPEECSSPRGVNPEIIIEAPVTKFTLSQNYPNPFRNGTIIRYTLPEKTRVNLSVFDMNGRLVKVLVNSIREAGVYTVNVDKGALGSGIYYYRMQAGGEWQVKKMVIQ